MTTLPSIQSYKPATPFVNEPTFAIQGTHKLIT